MIVRKERRDSATLLQISVQDQKVGKLLFRVCLVFKLFAIC